MKLPTPRKLPSGSWYVRIKIDGKTINITKPTRREAEQEAMALKSGFKDVKLNSRNMTLSSAIDSYISDRENVLSPSTIAGYRAIARSMFQSSMSRPVDWFTQANCQRIVNTEAKRVSAKYLKNAWSFVASVLESETGVRVSIRLPQVVKNDLPFLTPEQIPVFLKAIEGSPYEIPALLGLSSLRRSEILGLRWSDIDLESDTIRVAGSAVFDADHKLVYKQTNKNSNSNRVIPFILPQLRNAVEKADKGSEFVYTGNPNQVWVVVNRICEKNGLPKVGCHGLRRSYASLAYHIGMSEEVCMRTGGWSDIYTMRKIYTKVSQKDIHDQTKKFKDFFASL